MDDVLVSQKLEGLENLDGEATDQRQGDPSEVVVLDELVEVDGEELK